MFDGTQHSFVDLKKIIAEGTSPIYLWAGAGLSVPAGLPTWGELRAQMIRRAREFLSVQSELEDVDHREALLRVAETEKDLWVAFDRIFEAIGSAEYDRGILDAFSHAAKCDIPDTYRQLLSIKSLKGVITTNIDNLVVRALAEKFQIAATSFVGFDCDDFFHVLPGNSRGVFVLNLHGVVEKRSSWVMRKSELDELRKNSAYRNFLASLFVDKVVIFAGVDPTDAAVRSHLEAVRDYDMTKGTAPIYWLTDKTNADTLAFCDKYNIQKIVYSSADNHKDLVAAIKLLNEGKSCDEEVSQPCFVNIPTIERSARNFDEIDFDRLSPTEMRDVLNKKASKILNPSNPNAYSEYQDFVKRFRRQIHNAWFVDAGEELLGLEIMEKAGEGAFGRVFKAQDKDGTLYAVKVLKEDVMWRDEWLQSFRRGARAMRILSEKGVAGIVQYKFSSEIPAFVAMEWVDGPDLFDVVQQKQLSSWYDKLHVLCEVGKIIKSAHALPERILHRDIRPQNIMLRNFYGNDDYEVCVLDFDLAYHRDATEVSMQMGAGNGFSAPEQTSYKTRGTTRSSRVDSYGFAMLCYYVVTGCVPLPGQCLQVSWRETIMDNVCSHKCEEWVSLPYKMAEMITVCTDVDQNKRWDLYQIYDYIEALFVARNGRRVMFPTLLMDELVYRIASLMRVERRVVTECDGGRTFSTPSGTIFKFSIGKSTMAIDAYWHNDGKYEYGNISKTMGDRANALVVKLRNAGFKNASQDFEGHGVHVGVEVPIKDMDIKSLTMMAEVYAKNDIAPKTYA